MLPHNLRGERIMDEALRLVGLATESTLAMVHRLEVGILWQWGEVFKV
jgi:hypothetical protein